MGEGVPGILQMSIAHAPRVSKAWTLRPLQKRLVKDSGGGRKIFRDVRRPRRAAERGVSPGLERFRAPHKAESQSSGGAAESACWRFRSERADRESARSRTQPSRKA